MTLVRTKDQSNGRSTGVRKNPFGMYRDLGELFDNFFDAPARQEFATMVPAVNVGEDRDNYFVEVSAPGYKKEELNVAVENNVLTISAEHKREETTEDKKFSRREFSYGSFSRTFTLPESVDSDKINCRYTDGILKIDLPKREEAKAKPPRKIDIS